MLFLYAFKKIKISKVRFAHMKYVKLAMQMGEESNFRTRSPGFESQLYH